MHAFSIRALADGGTTLDDLRRALYAAPREANLVLLKVDDGALQFPRLCPNCGQTANSELRIERAFVFYFHGDDTSASNRTEAVIQDFEFPFCDACARRARTERRRPGPWTPLKRILSEAEGFAGIVAIAISCLFFKEFLKGFKLVPLLLGSFPLAIGFWLIHPIWKRSSYMSLPAPTSVDLAVDFTPITALAYEPAWRAFQFRSPDYTEKFRAANATQLWDPHGGQARSAEARRTKDDARTSWPVWVLFGIILIWFAWDELLKDLTLPLFHR